MVLLSRNRHFPQMPFPDIIYLCALFARPDEIRFSKETSLGRRCIYVPMETLSAQRLPSWVATFATEGIKPSGLRFDRIYYSMVLSLSVLLYVSASRLCSSSLPSGPLAPLTDNLRKGFAASMYFSPSSTLISGLNLQLR